MKTVLALLGLLMTWFSTGVVFAETADGADIEEEPVELEKIVVVAPPVIEGNLVDRFGAVSSVITQRQIRDLNAQDFATALRNTPGITISRYNLLGAFGGAEGGGVFIRGMGSSRPGSEIKTFIDGAPMYMGIWNHPLLDLLSVDTADAIEVYKSPQPARFGNAFAAINIVPKRRFDEGFQTNLKLAGGSYGTFVQTAEHGGRVGAIDYYLGQSFRKSDGHRENASGELRNYFLRLGAELGENWYVSTLGLHTDNFAWDPGPVGRPDLREGKYATEAWMGAVSLEHNHELTRGRYQVYINKVRGRQLERPDGQPDATWTAEFRGLRARESLTPWMDGELLLGIDYTEIEGDGRRGATDWRPETRRISSPYLAVSQLIGDPLAWHIIPSAGARLYFHNLYSSEIAPHAGLVLGRQNTSLHFGYSRGVIFPGLEVQALSELITPALGDSWRRLEAETLDHYEIGISHSHGRIRADLTVFRNEGRNRYVIVPPPPPPPVFENVGDYRTRGIETTLTYTPIPTLSFFTGLTILDSTPENLPYVPETTWSSGVNWRFMERFQLNLDGQYVAGMYAGRQLRRAGLAARERIGSHYLINGRLSYFPDFLPWNMDGEIFLAGENLTDVNYEYRPGYPMPGIALMAGMRVTF